MQYHRRPTGVWGPGSAGQTWECVSRWLIITRQPAVVPRHWPGRSGTPSWPGPVWCWSEFIQFPLASTSPAQTCPIALLLGSAITFSYFLFRLKSRLTCLASAPLSGDADGGSPPTLSDCVKTHLLLFLRISHVLSRTLSAVSSQGLRWLWPSTLLFLLWRLLLSTEETKLGNFLYPVCRKWMF